MADGHSGVLLQQEYGNRLANDIAPPYNNGVLTLQVIADKLEHLQAAMRRAGDIAFLANHQVADIDGMKAVHILFHGNSVNNRLLLNMVRQRQLDQNAVNPVVPVQPVDQCQQLFLGCFGRQAVNLGIKAQLLAGFFLVADVSPGGRVLTQQDYGHPRNCPCLFF